MAVKNHLLGLLSFTIALIIASFLTFVPMEAFAHKLIIFAWASDNAISVEPDLSGSRHLAKCNVLVTNDSTDEVVTQGVTDSKGIFSFPISRTLLKKPVDLKIVASTDDGHRAEWLMKRNEYGTSQASTLSSTPKSTKYQSPLENEKKCFNKEEFTSMIDESLEKKLAPLRRQLARIDHEKKTSVSDILGGIGYLIGLAGLATWLRHRR